MRSFILPGSGPLLAVIVAQGCAIQAPDPLHCGNNAGDAYCAEQFPDGSRPFCEVGVAPCASPSSERGCVAQRPADECYGPCGGRSTLAENGECLTTEESSGTSIGNTQTAGTETGQSTTTGPVPCVGDEDCTDDAAPFCDVGSGECVACDGVEDPDGACAGVDAGLPVCAGGMCVQCTAEQPEACVGQTPLCDDASNTCVPCVAHEECGPAACNLFTGACLPADAVVHVGGDIPDFDTLAEAVGSFGAEMEGTIVVYAGMADYNEAVTVSAGRTIAFLAAELGPKAPTHRWIRTSGAANPQLTVGPGTTVLLDGLELSLNGSSAVPGVRVNGGRAWLDRTRVVQNAGGGIVAQSNAELVLRNCFVGGEDNTAAVEVDASTARVTFSTLGGGTINAAGLSCTNADSVEIRSSLIVALGNAGTGGVDVVCSVANASYTATEVLLPGDGNVAVGELPLMTPEAWFAGYGTGDFHLQNQGLTVFADIAQWQLGDPLTDIDGDPRLAVDGTPDYAGADLPQ